MTASLSRKPDDSDSRLERFRTFTVAHPRLVEAKEALVNAIRGAEQNSLIFVFGPTGVGKTTLRLKTEQLITAEMLSELHQDRTRIPVVSVEAIAPESGSFNWRDHYKRLLHQLDEPLIDYKLGCPTEGSLAPSIPRFMPPSKAVGTDYRYAVEQAVRYRRPVAVMIDEAQHLGKIPSGRRLLDQLDVVEHSGRRLANDASASQPSGCPGVVSPELGCLSRSGHRWECPCPGTAYSVPAQHSPELVGRRDGPSA